MNKEEFYEALKNNNIMLTNKQKEQLDLFANLLIEYNEHTNITAIKSIEDIYLKHFYDSLTLVKVYNFNQDITVLDIGSGGGFPGIVLKIVFPNIDITLLDSNHKKTDFQNYIINILKLKKINAICDRAENYFNINRKFDLVVARAVANLNILSELCLPFVNINGYFIAMKGNADIELANANYAIEFLGGKVDDVFSFLLPIENSVRNLVIVKKCSNTPDGYPRVYDKILKKPLKKS